MRRPIWAGLVLSAAAHISLSAWPGLAEQQLTAKPLTTQFVKRAPRLTKPLELKKRPQPKRRPIRREMVAVKARVDRRTTREATLPVGMIGGLARPDPSVSRITGFQDTGAEPAVLAEVISGVIQAEQVVDMSLELMNVDALDTGEYQAMVIQDPGDKRNVRGFFHLVFAYSITMYNNDWHGMFSRRRIALTDLIEAVNRYTGIRADMVGTVTFDQAELLSVPWVFAGSHFNFRLTKSEAQNLGRYLMTGGFLFADAGWRNNAQYDKSLRQMIEDALLSREMRTGKDWNFERLPNSHAIYHCFFDFPNGPPIAGDWGFHKHDKPGAPYDYLEGVTIDGRLLAIVSLKWFAQGWSNAEMRNWGQDPVRAQQFGVNVIVFALTQEGSVTARLMDSVGR